MKTISLCLMLATAAAGEIHQNPGSTTPLPHQKYIHVVSEKDSPVQQVYIKSKDGLYIAAAIRKPKGTGVIPPSSFFTARRAAGGWNNWWAGRAAIMAVRCGSGSCRRATWSRWPTTAAGT
jgi:uncharacterized protein YcaQ